MKLTKRSLVKAGLWVPAALGAYSAGVNAMSGGTGKKNFKRITTEEAFITPEVMAALQKYMKENPGAEPGLEKLYRDAFSSKWGDVAGKKLIDLGEGRLKDMDEAGVAMQILSIGYPGVQAFDAEQGTALARSVNDTLADAVRAHPDRYAGLAAIAPQDPQAAAAELERAVKQLGLKGALINSHTKGEYLDEPKFRVIFEKAQELDVPIYIHPREPSPQMLAPYQKYMGLEAATWGFSAETGLHALRLILSGLFDDYPRLQIVLGHMGEGLPYYIERIDNRNSLYDDLLEQNGQRRLKKKPGEYLRENFYVTTSGMESEPALILAHSVMGADRVMFALDYPSEEPELQTRVLEEAPFSDEDKAKIFHRNAERLFRL